MVGRKPNNLKQWKWWNHSWKIFQVHSCTLVYSVRFLTRARMGSLHTRPFLSIWKTSFGKEAFIAISKDLRNNMYGLKSQEAHLHLAPRVKSHAFFVFCDFDRSARVRAYKHICREFYFSRRPRQLPWYHRTTRYWYLMRSKQHITKIMSKPGCIPDETYKQYITEN
jgi:hypothetical protein